MKPVNLQPKKSLGQNFLQDPNIARKIVAALNLNPPDVVLEIGPGYGALTRIIRPQVKHYFGVELDDALAEKLRDEFYSDSGFTLFHEDFLTLDFSKIVKPDFQLKVVGNIPYHITSSVIFKVIEQRHFFKTMTLMIQREVAQRVVAAPGGKDFGILAVLSQTFSAPKLLFPVSHHVFFPKPKVTSAVVQWEFNQLNHYVIDDEAGFMRMVKNLFQFRRKMLRNSLKNFYPRSIFGAPLPVDLHLRPEDLSIGEFIQLWEIIQKKNAANQS